VTNEADTTALHFYTVPRINYSEILVEGCMGNYEER
jgi:hypothetical protein